MKCFTHPQADAVAQCSQCQKGVCSTCAHDLDGNVFCSSCVETGLREEIARARRRVTGVWVFTGIITAIGAIVAFSQVSQAGATAILIIPVIFASAWCLFWGWPPAWNGFRRVSAGWGCAGSWLFLLIVGYLVFSILLTIAFWIGAFTGIQRYNEAKRLVANGEQMIAQLTGRVSQQLPGMPGAQGSGSA